MKEKLLILLMGTVVFWGGNTFVQAGHSDLSCADCHVSHRSGDPDDDGVYGVALWSTAHTADGLPTFELYSSPTLNARDISQPEGPSKLCLGCHDGTYELSKMSADTVFGPTDLANNHPVSFTYDSWLASADGSLNNPTTAASGLGGTIDQDLLDDQHRLQCSSCHDVHSSGIGRYMLRWQYAENDSQMCRVCHNR